MTYFFLKNEALELLPISTSLFFSLFFLQLRSYEQQSLLIVFCLPLLAFFCIPLRIACLPLKFSGEAKILRHCECVL